MEFGILGPLEVRDQHRRIEVSSAKERLLLAVLVLQANGVVSADRLIEALWGATPPVTAGNTLQTYVSHVRRALEPDRSPRAKDGVLRTCGRGYQLAVAPEAIDAVRFERLARNGRDTLVSDPARAAESLRAALRLWRGEPLAEFDREFFAQAEIARLTEMHAVAVEDRVEADLALGRHAALCAELSRAVVQRPWRERLWFQLILALYRCGQQATAVAAYTRLRAQLAEQLGIDPSPELVQLHTAVLAQHPDLDWRPPQGCTGPSVLTADELLPTARTALAAHDWPDAFGLLSQADQAAMPLCAEDIECLAEAAWWSGHYRQSLAARLRAHHAYLQAGDPRRAAREAAILAMHHAAFRQFAVANGWFQRAQRLLETEPDCAEHGYLSLATTFVTLGAGDLESCLVAAQSTYDLGVRHGVADLQALGMVFQGTVLIHRGQLVQGLALHDEGMAMDPSGGFLAQLAVVQLVCQVVSTCCKLGELPGRIRPELLRGRPAETAVLINAVLASGAGDRMLCSWLRPDLVVSAMTVDDLETARVAATELTELVQIYGSVALLAAAETARGALALATGEDDPLPPLHSGVELWREAGSSYQAARARVLLATALGRAGQAEAAGAELADARACFDRLGASQDAAAIAEPATIG